LLFDLHGFTFSHGAQSDAASLIAEKLPRGQVAMRICRHPPLQKEAISIKALQPSRGPAGCRRRAIVNHESIADGPLPSFAGDFKANLGRSDSCLAQKRPRT
jgi:hypothetical protein